MKPVIGFGALNVDNIFKVENLLLGENAAYSLDIQPGGSAANTIIALAKLNIPCGFMGITAGDIFGKLLISEFKRRKVDAKHVLVKKQQSALQATGSVEAFVDKKGRRLLFVKPGINDALKLADVDIKYLQNASMVHISSFVNNDQFEIQKVVVDKISTQVKVSFSPGSLYANRGLKEIRQIIEKSFIVFLDKKEIYQLTGKNFKVAADRLLKLGPKIIVVTLGKNGCFVATKERHFYSSAKKVKVVDTTGAGDAFSAGFLYGLLNKFALEKCSEIGNTVASFSVQKIGARAGLPNKKELNSVVPLKK